MTIATVPIRLSWTGATGSPGANVWHPRWDGDLGGSAQLAGLLEDLEAFYTAIALLFPPTWSANFDGEITGLGDDLGDSATYEAWSVVGTANTGNFLPPSNQMLVSWRTGSGGRRGRGRTFLGPVAVAVSDAVGTPTTGAIDVVQDAADALIAASSDPGNGAWGVYSRVDGVVRDFVTALVPDEFAVLRSRRD